MERSVLERTGTIVLDYNMSTRGKTLDKQDLEAVLDRRN